MKNKYLMIFSIAIFIISINGIFALNIGYLVKNPSSLNPNEEAIKNFLETKLYSIDILDNIPFDASQYDLIIVSETISNIQGIFDNKNHKTLFLSNSAAKNNWLGSEVGLTSGTEVFITNAKNIITEDFSQGDLKVYSSQTTIKYLKSPFQKGFSNLAYKSASSNSVLITFEVDSTKNINERNLFFGLIEATKWSSNTQILFENSINWLIDGQENNPPTLIYDIPEIIWTKGTTRILDLDNYFTDSDNGQLTYTVYETSEQDEITVTINNNLVTLTSPENWTGTDWVIFKASDKQSNILSNNVTLTVTDEAAVQITSYTPITNNPKILKNTNKLFTIIISDTTKTINWFLDNILVGTGSDYNFNKDLGDYTLRAVVGEPEITSQSWNINVKPIEDFTCSEAQGFICSATQFCSQDFLNTNQENCCPVTCTEKPLEFKDIDRENITDDITLEINDPNENEEFFLGDTIKIKLDINNNVNDNLDIDIKVSLYDLTEDNVVENYDFATEINEESRRIVSFDLEIPYDLNEDDDYAFFVQINDKDEEYFNENYVRINLDRKSDDLIIKKIETSDQVYCGDFFILKVDLTNIGSDEQDVYITAESSALDIDERTEVFNLQTYDEKDTITKDFNLKIPENTPRDIYSLKITTYFNNKKITQEKQIAVDCTEITTLDIATTNINSDSSLVNVSDKPNKDLLIFILSLTAILVISLIGSLIYLRKESRIKDEI